LACAQALPEQGYSDLQAAAQHDFAVASPETDAAVSILNQEADAQDTARQQPKTKVSVKLHVNSLGC